MLELDCLGDTCPIPAIMLEHALERCKPGDVVLLLTDHSCVPRSIGDICRKKGMGFVADEVETGVWELQITKT